MIYQLVLIVFFLFLIYYKYILFLIIYNFLLYRRIEKIQRIINNNNNIEKINSNSINFFSITRLIVRSRSTERGFFFTKIRNCNVSFLIAAFNLRRNGTNGQSRGWLSRNRSSLHDDGYADGSGISNPIEIFDYALCSSLKLCIHERREWLERNFPMGRVIK